VQELKKEAAEHYFTAKPKSRPRLGVIHAHLRGRYFEFLTASGVFSKSRVDLGTKLLIQSMILPEEGLVLDLGCGYGAVGIVAASLNPRLQVYMVDVNERAVWLAKQNAKRNHVENVKIKRGSLYAPVAKLKFDVILTNPPVSAGIETITKLIEEAPNHLKPNGSFQIVVRSKIAGKRFTRLLEEAFSHVEILSRKSGYRTFIAKT
jgi:16S rRNA G1207 methylase RsmC